ncbi:hypothetical protein [Brevundimonas sp. GN22]
MKKSILLAVVGLSLAACHMIDGTNQNLIKEAKKDVASVMHDPSAAEFRNLRVVKTGSMSVVCGEVNGKNRYGAYVGFTRFMSSPKNLAPLIEDLNSDNGFAQAYSMGCKQS